MKRLFLILCCLCLFFCSCSKNKPDENIAESQASANNIDMAVATEISNLLNSNDFSDETIKALSVIVRTNLLNEETKFLSESNEYNSNVGHIYDIVSETSGQVLVLENEDEKVQTIYINQQNEDTWTKEIKKVEILKFLNKNNISLASVSNIKPEKDKFGRTKNLNFNGKILPFEKIMNEFDIPSNDIQNIESTLATIKIHGRGVGTGNDFNLKEAENMSKNGFGYEKILKNSNNNFKIITRK